MGLACVLIWKDVEESRFSARYTYFPDFLERTFPSSGGLLEHSASFQMRTQATSVRTQVKNPHGFPSFSQKASSIGAQGHFGRDGEGTFGEKQSVQKLEKQNFRRRTQCTKPSTGGP